MTYQLPAPAAYPSQSLADCIGSRRSIREYAEAGLSLQHLSLLLWSAQGHTGSDGQRATPSAAGLYPLQLQVVVRRVAALRSGIYEYRSVSHSLRLLENGVPELEAVAIGSQPWLTEAAIVIGLSAKLEESVKHFSAQPPQGKRGARYAYMESGALSQNLHLQATDLGLACVLVGGFEDEKAKAVLKLTSDLEPIALICIGRRRSAQQ